MILLEQAGAGIAQVVTAAVAVAGLGLSVYNAIKAHREKQPRVKVDAGWGFIGLGPNLSDDMMLMNVRNHGERPVTINSLTFRIPDKRTLVLINLQGDRPMPCTIEPSTAAAYWTEYKNVVNGLRREGYRGKIKIRLRAGDTLGNEYFGKPFKLDLS